MREIAIRLRSLSDVKEFVSICEKQEGASFDLLSNHHAVDGKSIVGVVSTDWSKPMRLQIYCKGGDKEEEAVVGMLKKYTVGEEVK